MVTRTDIQTLIHRPYDGKRIMSVFLDTSVGSDNKRHYRVFLDQQKSHCDEMVVPAFERIDAWLEAEYNETNKGVAIFLEIDGDWIQGFQVSVHFENRLNVGERPVVGPLAEIVEKQRHHVVALVDREHFRMLSIYLGEILLERTVDPDAYPTTHDARGGPPEANFQQYKAEETLRFYRDFSKQLSEFCRLHTTDDIVLLGTDENVKNFMEVLPAALLDRVAHTAHGNVSESASEILVRLAGFFDAQVQLEIEETLSRIRDRVKHRHLASAGAEDTLVQLQEGKVDRLVVARDMDQTGSRCQKCGFILARQQTPCPYCGGKTESGVDLAEAMIWIAQEQDVPVEFAARGTLSDLDGVGAFLKF